MCKSNAQLTGCGQPDCPVCSHVDPVFSLPAGLLPAATAAVASPAFPAGLTSAPPTARSFGYPVHVVRVVPSTISLTENVSEVQVEMDTATPDGDFSSVTIKQVVIERRLTVSFGQPVGLLDQHDAVADLISAFFE